MSHPREQIQEQATELPGSLPGPWNHGELPAAPRIDVRSWLVLLGPGLLLAGTAVGTGEWLLGPAVSAQYGSTILWLATLSIIAQVFLNIEVMRYAMYCGEPIHVGFMRTAPGPWLWVPLYLAFDFAVAWPMNAGAAAVPLAAAFLGRLPGDGTVQIAGQAVSETSLVRGLSIGVFLLSLVPLVFGGAIYRMLERMMAVKLAVVLSFLLVVSCFMVARHHWTDVAHGLVRFGQVPIRPDTLVVGRHFWASRDLGARRCKVRGSFVDGKPEIVGFAVTEGKRTVDYDIEVKVPKALRGVRLELAQVAQSHARPGGFYVESRRPESRVILLGTVDEVTGRWQFEQATVEESGGVSKTYGDLASMPDPVARRCRNLLEHLGNEDVNLFAYWFRYGELPALDWMILAAFASYAGAGGFANTLFSNFARDKGWGMGSLVGAIPSAVGGSTIKLSHVGAAFEPTPESLPRWRGWLRWATRDQLCVWMFCSIAGMALPCMLSLEFVRHAPITGNRISAMMADGMAHRYPQFGQGWWIVTLLVGFLIVFPAQVMTGDGISRRWTDIAWVTSRRLQRLSPDRVKYVYYTILAAYASWGLYVLTHFTPLFIVTISGAIGNVAVGLVSLHTLAINRRLLPAEVRPGWPMQLGLACCATFFLGISLIVLWHTW